MHMTGGEGSDTKKNTIGSSNWSCPFYCSITNAVSNAYEGRTVMGKYKLVCEWRELVEYALFSMSVSVMVVTTALPILGIVYLFKSLGVL